MIILCRGCGARRAFLDFPETGSFALLSFHDNNVVLLYYVCLCIYVLKGRLKAWWMGGWVSGWLGGLKEWVDGWMGGFQGWFH